MKPPLLVNNNQSIGVFDSGLGGLIVLKALEKQLPKNLEESQRIDGKENLIVQKLNAS